MRDEYNKTTLMGKFIKQLVATNPVPIVSTWEPGQFVVENLSYISKDFVLKARHSGTPTAYDDTGTFVGRESEYIDYYFDKVEPYVFGEVYRGITTIYHSNSVDYDASTHYYLGEYLRLYKIKTGINLLPFYNCFSGAYIDNIDFNMDKDKNITFKVVDTKTYKVAVVPVKYGKTYTIGLNCGVGVEIISCFYDGNKFMSQSSKAINNIQNSTGESENTYKKFYNTSINKPFTYNTPTWETLMTKLQVPVGQYERYYVLLIKLPRSIDTPISVVEGDYSHCNDAINTTNNTYAEFVGDLSSCHEVDDGNIAESYLTMPLELFKSTLTKSIAFSDRLVEYLLLNVIDSADELTNNIKKVQDNLPISIPKVLYGIWTESMKYYIYTLAMLLFKNSIVMPIPYDINGYVDKDIESVLK